MGHLITGSAGTPHITPKNDAVIHRGMMGVESCILDYGEKLAPALIPSQPTNIRILDGCGMMQGRFFEIEEGSYDTIAIPNGAQGYNRIDIVCAKITQNENGTQSFSWEVVQGTQTSGTPQPPTVAEGSLDDGDEFALMPIASVELEGVNIVAVETVAEYFVLPIQLGGTGKSKRRSSITLKYDGPGVLTSAFNLMLFDGTFSQVGDGLAFDLQSHGIVVGKGIDYIMVCGELLCGSGLQAGDTIYFNIYQNGEIVFSGGYATAYTTAAKLVMEPKLLPVTEGDIITMQVRNTANRGNISTVSGMSAFEV